MTLLMNMLQSKSGPREIAAYLIFHSYVSGSPGVTEVFFFSDFRLTPSAHDPLGKIALGKDQPPTYCFSYFV